MLHHNLVRKLLPRRIPELFPCIHDPDRTDRVSLFQKAGQKFCELLPWFIRWYHDINGILTHLVVFSLYFNLLLPQNLLQRPVPDSVHTQSYHHRSRSFSCNIVTVLYHGCRWIIAHRRIQISVQFLYIVFQCNRNYDINTKGASLHFLHNTAGTDRHKMFPFCTLPHACQVPEFRFGKTGADISHHLSRISGILVGFCLIFCTMRLMTIR